VYDICDFWRAIHESTITTSMEVPLAHTLDRLPKRYQARPLRDPRASISLRAAISENVEVRTFGEIDRETFVHVPGIRSHKDLTEIWLLWRLCLTGTIADSTDFSTSACLDDSKRRNGIRSWRVNQLRL
jgi:hypothetical protein